MRVKRKALRHDLKILSSGFTLVEMMIVILLLGIVAAVAIPVMNGAYYEMKVDAAAREIVGALRYAQSLSIKEGKEYGVKFDASLETFTCYEKSTAGTIRNPHDKKLYTIDFTVEGYMKGVDIVTAVFGATDTFVEFNALGEPTGTGGIIVSCSDYTRTISLVSPTGKITIL